MESLYSLTFKEYIDRNPELKATPSKTQQSRYHHFEDKRKKMVAAVKEQRQLIINEEESTKEKSSTSKKSKGSSVEQMTSTAIKQERERLERIKKKQESDLKNKIEYEIQMEENRQKSQQRMEDRCHVPYNIRSHPHGTEASIFHFSMER